MGSSPKSRRSLEVGHGNLLQCAYLENSVDRRAWQVTVCGAAKSQTRLSDLAYTHVCTHTQTHTHSHTAPIQHLPQHRLLFLFLSFYLSMESLSSCAYQSPYFCGFTSCHCLRFYTYLSPRGYQKLYTCIGSGTMP